METVPSAQTDRPGGRPIALFVATRTEAGPLARALGLARRSLRHAGATARGRLWDRDILLARTGVGPANAEAVARRLLEAMPCAAALAVGVAAGLTPCLRPGDVVIAARVTRGRQTTAAPDIVCDPEWLDWARSALDRSGGRCRVGPIATVGEVLATGDAKRALAEMSGALAADMESWAIASVAAARAIPFLAIRVILDPATEDLPVAIDRLLDERGDPRARLLARFLFAHPFALPALLSLGWRTRTASARLARTLASLPGSPV